MEDGGTLERVRPAIAGQLDPATLTGEERRYYYSLLDDVMVNPSPDGISVMARLGGEPGAVGYNKAGELVRVRADGSHQILNDDGDIPV